jgi:hypothetical protein
MWQPWQTLANNCSPLDSVNLKFGLSTTSGRDSFCADIADGSDKTARHANPTSAERRGDIIESHFADPRLLDVIALDGIALEDMALHPHDTFMQPRDGIER